MKKTISVFLIIAVLICNVNIYRVKAATNWFAVLTNAADVFVNTATPTEQSTLQLINDFLQTNGFASAIANSVSPVSDDIIKYFASQIDSSQANKTLQENIEAIRECVETGFTGGDSSVTFNSTLHNAIYNTANYYVEENKIDIWYTADIQQSTPTYLNNAFIAAVMPVIEDNPDCYYILYRLNNSTLYWFCIPKNNGKIYGVLAEIADSSWHSFNLYRCKDVSGVLTYEPIMVRDEDIVVYWWDNVSTLTKMTDNSDVDSGFANRNLGAFYCIRSGVGTADANFQRYPKGFSTDSDYIQTFNSVNALDTYIHTVGIGKQPYYYNNQVWSDFSSHTSGDYTVDNSNVNTVTYGDVISYVNDSHDTNNNYPDNSTVNNWIETTNNNNTGGGSGGGSGGSGDDSGGSGTGIVSILTALGKAIADLITGIAAFLAEVVGGLVEAITGLLDTLTDLITNFTESIPNIFSPLLGWLFDGLPEEFTAIILLGLTACVIASIIKILRG